MAFTPLAMAVVSDSMLAIRGFSSGATRRSGRHRQRARCGVRVFEDGRFIQVLYGDPDREGGHYVIRIGNDDGQIVFPHRHPEDEHIVVIQGTWFLGHGEVFNRAALEEMPVGAIACSRRKARELLPTVTELRSVSSINRNATARGSIGRWRRI